MQSEDGWYAQIPTCRVASFQLYNCGYFIPPVASLLSYNNAVHTLAGIASTWLSIHAPDKKGSRGRVEKTTTKEGLRDFRG
jgi:hypothetical protein